MLFSLKSIDIFNKKLYNGIEKGHPIVYSMSFFYLNFNIEQL